MTAPEPARTMHAALMRSIRAVNAESAEYARALLDQDRDRAERIALNVDRRFPVIVADLRHAAKVPELHQFLPMLVCGVDATWHAWTECKRLLPFAPVGTLRFFEASIKTILEGADLAIKEIEDGRVARIEVAHAGGNHANVEVQ